MAFLKIKTVNLYTKALPQVKDKQPALFCRWILSVLKIERKSRSYSFQASIKSGIGVKQTLVIPSYHSVFDEVFLVLLSALETTCCTLKFLTYSFSLTLRNIASNYLKVQKSNKWKFKQFPCSFFDTSKNHDLSMKQDFSFKTDWFFLLPRVHLEMFLL